MSFKVATFFALAAVFLSPAFAADAASDKAPASAEAPAEETEANTELEAEIAYAEALVNANFPDLAAIVIEATKKRWPESEAAFFALEIRGLLSLGKFDEVEKKIGALPDRKGTKYWAARLELANNYSLRKRKKECSEIYDAFFKQFATPPKELISFYMNACYAWGQLLTMDGRFEEATQVYERLLKQKLALSQWCMMACETCEIYIRLATAEKDEKKRKQFLASASRLADKLLAQPDQALYFGRAIAMKAHIELMGGKVNYAQELIDEFMPQLLELHENIVRVDPDGKKGLRKFSPLPQCRFLLAEMLWKEAKETYDHPTDSKDPKKPGKRDDEQVKAYLFGAKENGTGRRNGQGCYNHALNVFLKYPESTWAAQAGELADQIENFAIEKYKAKIQKKVTPEMVAQVRQAQWREASSKMLDGDLSGAVQLYLELLGKYPELGESISAIEQVINGLLDLIALEKDEAQRDWLRLKLDAIEAYLAERFAGASDRMLMMTAGDAVRRTAEKEKTRGDLARANELRKRFIANYREHPNASKDAAGMANVEQEAGHWSEAVDLWKMIGAYYTNSVYYAASLSQLSKCYAKLGDITNQLEAMKAYVEVEPNVLQRLQAQLNLAQMYQKRGYDMLKMVDGLSDQEAAEKTLRAGSAQIVRGIQQFKGFAKQADEQIANPATSAEDKAKYVELKDAALFLVGECWSRIKKPENRLDDFRKRAAESFEHYLEVYPKGKYAPIAYVKLGMIYTALGDLSKSKDALDRLTKHFPDSKEAKNAKPSLALSLIEMGMRNEGAQIYAEMLDTDGAYSANQFANAGEALIEAKSWELADRAFEKAIKVAGTNQMSVVARARIGQANALFRQNRLAEARESLDLFLANERMSKMSIAADAWLLMVEIASEQGRTEKDTALRGKHFGAAVGAVKKLRNYWKSKPQWEQDTIDLMSADVVIRRMKAEEAMGLKEEAAETRAKAAAMLQTFRQSRGVSPTNPADKMSEGDRNNLERCYATMIPLFTAMGAKQTDRVMKFGQEYLDLFPNGKARTEIVNCMNRARAETPVAAPAEGKSENKGEAVK